MANDKDHRAAMPQDSSKASRSMRGMAPFLCFAPPRGVKLSYEQDKEEGASSTARTKPSVVSGSSVVVIRHCSSTYDPLPDGNRIEGYGLKSKAPFALSKRRRRGDI